MTELFEKKEKKVENVEWNKNYCIVWLVTRLWNNLFIISIYEKKKQKSYTLITVGSIFKLKKNYKLSAKINNSDVLYYRICTAYQYIRVYKQVPGQYCVIILYALYTMWYGTVSSVAKWKRSSVTRGSAYTLYTYGRFYPGLSAPQTSRERSRAVWWIWKTYFAFCDRARLQRVLTKAVRLKYQF